MTNEPIEPQDYQHGTTVVDIGDLRVARGLTRRPASTCRHRNMHYDSRERRVWCPDCKGDVDPFDAFMLVVENYDEAYRRLLRVQADAKEAMAAGLRSIAARNVDQIWRGRTMLPCCPACHAPLFPEDFVKVVAAVGREIAYAKRARNKK